MKKLSSNFLFFILLIFFSLLVIFSSLFFKKLMLAGAVRLSPNTHEITQTQAKTTKRSTPTSTKINVNASHLSPFIKTYTSPTFFFSAENTQNPALYSSAQATCNPTLYSSTNINPNLALRSSTKYTYSPALRSLTKSTPSPTNYSYNEKPNNCIFASATKPTTYAQVSYTATKPTVYAQVSYTTTKPTTYAQAFFTTTNNESYQTKEILSTTPLYKTTTDDPQNLANIYFFLPKTYYVEILNSCKLDSGADGFFVRYGETEGYCLSSSLSADFSTIATTQSGITLKMYPDAGTYIRSTPSIADNKIRIIPQSTSGIIYIGSISGDTPTDGTTNTWYYVEYNISDTKTVLGYIYSERGILSAPLTELTRPNQTPTTPEASKTENTATTPTADTNINPSLNLSVSPALKWVIALLFIIPVIVIFALLIKKPRKNADLVQDFANSEANFPTDEDLIPEFNDTTSPSKPNRKKVKFSSKIDPFVKFSTTLETSSELSPENSAESTNNSYPIIDPKSNYNSPASNYKINPNSNYIENSTPNKNLFSNTSQNQSQNTNSKFLSKNLDNSYEKSQNVQKNSKMSQNFSKKSAKSSNFTDPTIFYKNSTAPRLSLLGEDPLDPDCIKTQNAHGNSSLPPEINLENSYSDYYENITNKVENLENRDILSKPKFPKINIDDGYEFAEDFSISPTINFSLGKADSPRTNLHNPPRRNSR